MARRPDIRRAGAFVLIVVAVAALARAGPQSAPATARAHPARSAPPHRGIGASPGAPGASASTATPLPPVETIPPGRSPVRVPILMYHYVRINPDPRDQVGFGLSVTPADFAAQMDWLSGNGFHPVDLDDLRGYLLGHGTLPARPVVLTFDDGYRDLYTTAFPILRAHGFRAVAYVVSGFIGAPRYLTQAMLLELDAGGVQVGAHTVSHADLTRLSPADLHHEVFDSREVLEALLGHPVLDFCYPFGRFDDGVVRMVQSAGFESATTTDPGVSHAAADRFTWTRVRVGGGEPLRDFVANLDQPEPSELQAPPQAPAPAGRGRLPVTSLRPFPAARAPGPPIEGPIP